MKLPVVPESFGPDRNRKKYGSKLSHDIHTLLSMFLITKHSDVLS